MDLAPPPYSEYQHYAKERVSWNWAKLDKYITAERITPKVFFALQSTLTMHVRHYGRAKRQHGGQNFDLRPFENSLWWARTCSIVLGIFRASAYPSCCLVAFSRMVEVLKHAGFEFFGEYESYFWLNGEVTTLGEAFGIADTFLHELEIQERASVPSEET